MGNTVLLLPAPTYAESASEEPRSVLRHEIKTQLLRDLGDTEATQHMLEYIEELWETMDLLAHRFGKTFARAIIDAPVSQKIDEEQPYLCEEGDNHDTRW